MKRGPAGIVAEGAAKTGDGTGEHRLGDKDLRPHGVDQGLTRNHITGRLREPDQDIHHLRFELDIVAARTRQAVELRLDQPLAEGEGGVLGISLIVILEPPMKNGAGARKRPPRIIRCPDPILLLVGQDARTTVALDPPHRCRSLPRIGSHHQS